MIDVLNQIVKEIEDVIKKSEVPANASCGCCMYWGPYFEDSKQGLCRVDPPTMIVVDERLLCDHPTTIHDNLCRHWTPIKDKVILERELEMMGEWRDRRKNRKRQPIADQDDK